MSHDWTNNVYQLTGKAADTIMSQIELMLETLKSGWCGAGFPADPVAGMRIYNTNDHILYIRNEANDDWIAIIDLANLIFLGLSNGTIAGGVETDMLANAAVNTDKTANSAISRPKLKTSTGVVSGTGNGLYVKFQLQDYCFMPSAWLEYGNLSTAGYQASTDPGDTVARFAMGTSNGHGYSVRYRYVTSSDQPFIYAIRNAAGEIDHIWACEDPPPDYWGLDHPPIDFVPPIELLDADGKKQTPTDEVTIFKYDLAEYHDMINRAKKDKNLLHSMLNDEYELINGNKIFTRKNLAEI